MQLGMSALGHKRTFAGAKRQVRFIPKSGRQRSGLTMIQRAIVSSIGRPCR